MTISDMVSSPQPRELNLSSTVTVSIRTQVVFFTWQPKIRHDMTFVGRGTAMEYPVTVSATETVNQGELVTAGNGLNWPPLPACLRQLQEETVAFSLPDRPLPVKRGERFLGSDDLGDNSGFTL